MHHATAAEMRDDSFNGRLVADVSFDDGERSVADRTHTFQRLPVAVAEIIQNYNILADTQKLDADVRTDIPGTASDQYHASSIFGDSDFLSAKLDNKNNQN
jgi:hypothetical protein